MNTVEKRRARAASAHAQSGAEFDAVQAYLKHHKVPLAETDTVDTSAGITVKVTSGEGRTCSKPTLAVAPKDLPTALREQAEKLGHEAFNRLERAIRLLRHKNANLRLQQAVFVLGFEGGRMVVARPPQLAEMQVLHDGAAFTDARAFNTLVTGAAKPLAA